MLLIVGLRHWRVRCLLTWFTVVALSGCLYPRVPQGEAVAHCYLTWQGDASTTMTVNFHTTEGIDESIVYYDTESRGGFADAYAFEATGTVHAVPNLNHYIENGKDIHVVELTGLVPGETYYFIAGDSEHGYTSERKLRTIPRGDVPLRFVTGGDMGTGAAALELAGHAAALDPMFGLIGGDIAYANGLLQNWETWETWLSMWEEAMVTSDGVMIPMVVGIGNHEVEGSYGQFTNWLSKAPFYFGYFAQDGKGGESDRRAYFSRQFGANTLILVLDSGHVTSIGSEQADWIAETMFANGAIPNIFAVYHVPMYPSHRDFDSSRSVPLREHWLPLFDEHWLTAAFENHDHMFKRTKRMINSVPDPEGTLYIGDGAFGRDPRAGTQAQALEDPAELERLGLVENYLASWATRRNFWLVEVPASDDPFMAGPTFTAIDEMGIAFDTYTLAPVEAASARLDY